MSSDFFEEREGEREDRGPVIRIEFSEILSEGRMDEGVSIG